MKLERIRKKLQQLKKRNPDQALDALVQGDIDQDAFPTSPVPNVKTNDVIYALVPDNDVIGAAFDLTGRFPQRSSSGNQYVLVGYHFDANYIAGVPIKSRAASVITGAWQQLHSMFTLAGVTPNL